MREGSRRGDAEEPRGAITEHEDACAAIPLRARRGVAPGLQFSCALDRAALAVMRDFFSGRPMQALRPGSTGSVP